MVKKKKKTKIKHKQKVDLQEPQESMDDKSTINESKPGETIVEEPEIEEGMVYCKSCSKDIEPYPVENNRWRCPDCQKYTQSPDMKGKSIEMLKETKPSKDRPYEIHSSRNIKFSGNELAQAEMLIASGVASNFNDLAKKAFNILFLKEKVNKAFGTGTNKMENQEPNPEKTMKQIQDQKLMEAYIKSMDKGNNMDPLQMMMLMRMMDNQGAEKDAKENGFMDKLLEIQMMKSVTGNNQNAPDQNLQREVTELKHQMQMNQLMGQQQQMQKGNQSSQEFMQAMENIRAERDKSIKQAEVNAQQERDKNLQLAFDNRKIELESRLKSVEKEMKEKGSGQAATHRIQQMKEEIAAIKEMSKVLGDKEKGAGEYISETITNVATQLQPAVTRYIEQKQQQATQPSMQSHPMAEQPQQIPQENPEASEYQEPEFPMPKVEMSESEKQMSDRLSDMYNNPTKEKKE